MEEMALKLDMSKAYDRVEWVWLEKIMEELGFAERWRSLVMKRVTSVNYAIKVNGCPFSRSNITPIRGIHQGDPLSPYLFLLCAEGLSSLITAFVANGVLKGIFVCRGGPVFFHLFFANDSLIFCKAFMEDCAELQRVLGVYERALVQQLNREKTSFFFSKNTPRKSKEKSKEGLGLKS